MVPAGLPEGIHGRPGLTTPHSTAERLGHHDCQHTYHHAVHGRIDCNEAGLNEPGSRRGVAAYALDASDAALLWQVSVDTLASAHLA